MRNQFDTIIIGGGIFGQVIAAQLRSMGVDLAIFDARFEDAGSRPAACLMKPSWFSSMGKQKYDPALNLLDRLYGLHSINFKTGPINHNVYWIPPHLILKPATEESQPVIEKAVVKFRYNLSEMGHQIATGDGSEYFAKRVIVAAGVWSNNFVKDFEVNPVPGLQGKKGAAFLWRQEEIDQPFISPWAPFKQIVAFNRGDGLWAGDGSAILAKNWTDERLDKSRLRCAGAVDQFPSDSIALVGQRPYAQTGDPCYIKRFGTVTIVTGGAKNGTIAAGWAANQLTMSLG